MAEIQMYTAGIVQVRQPAPPPPPPPKQVAAYTSSSVQAYVPGSAPAKAPAPASTVTDASGKQAYSAIDLSAPKVRGTQPLELPKDWMDSLPPAATSALQKLDPLSAAADSMIKTLIGTMGGNIDNLPPGAAAAVANAIAQGKLTLPAALGASPSGSVTALGEFSQQLATLAKSDPAIKALIDLPSVRTALMGLLIAGSGVIAGSHAGADGDSLGAYSRYEVPLSDFDDYFAVSEKRQPAPSATPFDALYDAMNSYRTPEGQPLSAEQTKAIWDYYGTATTNASPEVADQVAQDIYNLLQRDRLTAPDSFGKTALDYFEQFSTSPKAWQLGSTSKAEIAREILHTMVRPIDVSQGNGTRDCAEATLQSQMAFEHPADYARIAVGLTTRGVADIPGPEDGAGPEKLHLPQLNLADQAGRPMLDFAFQSALRNYVGAKPADGLTAKQVETIQDGVSGVDYVTLPKEDFIRYGSYLMGKAGVDDEINNAVKDGFGATLKVTLDLDGVQHSMAIMKLRIDGASLWDPATGKIFKVPLDTLLHDVVRVSAPSSWLIDNFQLNGGLDDQTEGGLSAGSAARRG